MFSYKYECICGKLSNLYLFGSLDTFPYAGTTTTCESLYMGVPCVTMGGSVHAHNVGVSLLNTVGKKCSFLVMKDFQIMLQMLYLAVNI